MNKNPTSKYMEKQYGNRKTHPVPEQPGRHSSTVRLDPAEYAKLEHAVAAALQPFTRQSDAGSLGIQTGANIVLQLIRKGFINA